MSFICSPRVVRSAAVLVMLALAVTAVFLPATPVLAQGVPESITYQGKVTDASGQPLPDGSNAMRFKFFNAESGGTQLWDSGAMNVGVKGGIFSVVLGASPTPPITSATLGSADVWLEVSVGTDPPLPRTKLSSSPFALRAGDLTLPFSKTVSSASAPAFEVKNTGANYAIRGESSSSSFAGIAGVNTAGGQGVYGSTVSGSAVYGYNTGTGNLGFLASSTIGAYGSASGSGYGVYGTNSGSGPGVYGVNTGTGRAGQFKVENSGSSAPALYATTTGTGPAAWFDGKVGIGLSNPNRPLYIAQKAVGLVYPLKLDNPHSTFNTDAVGILFSTGGDGGGNLNVSRGKGALAYDYTGTWNRGKFHFLQEPSANDSNPNLANSVMTIANNGYVGIGTTSPVAKLHVQGASGALMRVDGGTSGVSGVTIHKNNSPRWTMLFQQTVNDDLIFRNDAAANDTLVLKAGTHAAQVNGDLAVTGAYKGNIGPNNGAPFPRPAYDSGWVSIAQGSTINLTHNLGLHPDQYLVDVQQKTDNVRSSQYANGERYTVGTAGFLMGTYWQIWYDDPNVLSVTREYDDYRASYVRVRIWVVN